MKNSITPARIGQRIREIRERLGLSMRECAGRARIATSFLSKVEAGRASPTMMTLQKILESLDTDLGTFFGDSTRESSRPLVFPHRAMRLVHDRDRKWLFAFPRRRDIRMIMTCEEYRPRTRVVECEHHATDLAGFVIEGELTLEIPGQGTHRVRKNDAFYLPAHRKHFARNEGAQPLRMVAVQLRA
jgi:transcriptional regulator with XRE-family HTH domain